MHFWDGEGTSDVEASWPLNKMLKLQILPDKGDTTSNNYDKREILSLSNFSHAAILDFIMSLCCPIVLQCKQKKLCFQTQALQWLQKIQARNLKATIFPFHYKCKMLYFPCTCTVNIICNSGIISNNSKATYLNLPFPFFPLNHRWITTQKLTKSRHLWKPFPSGHDRQWESGWLPTARYCLDWFSAEVKTSTHKIPLTCRWSEVMCVQQDLHWSFSSMLPLDVTDKAQMNSLNSIVPS